MRKCPHGKCPHNPTEKCFHGKRFKLCVECCGAYLCEHDHERSTCKECKRLGTGGTSLCDEHHLRRNNCVKCGGVSICEHHIQRSTCKKCKKKLKHEAVADALLFLAKQPKLGKRGSPENSESQTEPQRKKFWKGEVVFAHQNWMTQCQKHEDPRYFAQRSVIESSIQYWSAYMVSTWYASEMFS